MQTQDVDAMLYRNRSKATSQLLAILASMLRTLRCPDKRFGIPRKPFQHLPDAGTVSTHVALAGIA